MGEPPALTFAPVDFESQTLHDGLRAAGFCEENPAYFSWLGVTPYLTPEAFESSVGFIGSLPSGTAVTFDYAVHRSELNSFEKLALDRLSKKVESVGEPFQLFFEREQLAALLRRLGFDDLEDVGSDELNTRYLTARSDRLRLRGGVGRIMKARKS
jgi:O-methyltransferase involved in polyketide biosynthesis